MGGPSSVRVAFEGLPTRVMRTACICKPDEYESKCEARKIHFRPGRIGVFYDYDTGKIETVSPDGQAESRGVLPGWRMTAVNENTYSKEAFVAATEGSRDFTITFADSIHQETSDEWSTDSE